MAAPVTARRAASGRQFVSIASLRRSIRISDLALGAGLVLLGLVAAASLRLFEAAEAREGFRGRARRASAAIGSAASRPLEPTLAIAGLFAASEKVERFEFQAFTAPLLHRHPALYALEWLPRIGPSGLAALEQEARESGVPSFRVWEEDATAQPRRVGVRESYAPIFQMEPPKVAALGFDVLSSPARLGYADRARDSGEPVATARFRLVEDPPDTDLASVAIYQPAYRGGVPPATLESKRELLLGYAVAVFRLGPLIDALLQGLEADDLVVVAWDVTGRGPRELLHSWGVSPSEVRSSGLSPGSFEAFLLEIADRSWMLEIAPSSGHHRPPWRGPLAIALLGLVLGAATVVMRASARTISSLRLEAAASRRVGPYTLVRRLGGGGMGVVWEARHALLKRPTAVKLIAPELATEDSLARFEREVQTTSQLSHPNTVEIYDYGRTRDGIFYYSMELLRGIDLDHLLHSTGPLPPGRIVHLLKQAAAALAEAHSAGLVHRDVKPANLMTCTLGGVPDFVKVLDFGLVKELRPEPGPTLSRDGTALGTPLYLAPEGLSRPAEVDARLDVYALGAIGYFLLTGAVPFSGSSAFEIFAKQQKAPPDRPSQVSGRDVPVALEDLLLECLAFEPSDRPADGGALAAALNRLSVLLPWTDAEARRWWAEVGDPLLQSRMEDAEEPSDRRATIHPGLD